MRAEFSPATKRAAADRAAGHCEMIWNGERCNAPLRRGEHIYDHRGPDYFTKDNSLDNCQVICRSCDKLKYSGIDRPAIDRAKRIRDRDRGIKPVKGRELPCKRNSRFKMKIGGQIVLRSTGEPAFRRGSDGNDQQFGSRDGRGTSATSWNKEEAESITCGGDPATVGPSEATGSRPSSEKIPILEPTPTGEPVRWR